jgi:hypothetical protein
VDVWADGPAGIGVLIAATLSATGMVVAARPRLPALVFLATGLLPVSFVVVRASPVLLGLDLIAGIGLFALAVLARPVTRLLLARGRILPAVPRALFISLSVGLGFALLLGSADAVFADLLRSPFERVVLPDLSRHVLIVRSRAPESRQLSRRSASTIRASITRWDRHA